MKLKVKSTSYSVKPKQNEGKLVVRYDSFTVKPKQSEGKLLILNRAFTVKPKPDGIRIYATNTRSVVKTDARNGLKIYRQSYSSVLKHDRRSGVLLYRANNIFVLKQTCDGTIFLPLTDLTPDPVNWIAGSPIFGTISTNSIKITGIEQPIQLVLEWIVTQNFGGSFSYTIFDTDQVFSSNGNLITSPQTITINPGYYLQFSTANMNVQASVKNASDGNAVLDTFTLNAV